MFEILMDVPARFKWLIHALDHKSLKDENFLKPVQVCFHL